MVIDKLDREWFNYGIVHGMNRKKPQPSAERITNLGKQGVITIPTPEQVASYRLGLAVGRMKIVQNLDIVKYKFTQGKKGLSTADILTLVVVERQGLRGQYVDIPIYFKNSKIIVQENYKGVVGFQLKLGYDAELLDFISIVKASSWTGTLQVENTISGVILAQGLKPVPEKEDIALCYIRFYVKPTVSEYISKIPLRQEGSVGTGSGSELLTYDKDNDIAYITPIKLQSGAILLEAKEREPLGSITIPSTGTSTIGTGNTEVSYDFTATVSSPEGMVGGGVSAWVNVYLDGVLIGQQRVPLEDGEKNYQGKIPITLPSLTTGKITYEIVVEPNNPEDTFYYVFIKAGALFILESEVKREEVNELSDLSRLKTTGADIKIGSILTMKLVETKEPVNLEELNSDIKIGSILTMKLVEPPKQFDPKELSTDIKIGSILTIKIEDKGV